MRVKIYDTVVSVSPFYYFTAKRLNKHITQCMNLIDKYKVRDRLHIELECHGEIVPFVYMKFNRYVPIIDVPMIGHDPFKYNGAYIFNGDRKFNINDFYNKVIAPLIETG